MVKIHRYPIISRIWKRINRVIPDVEGETFEFFGPSKSSVFGNKEDPLHLFFCVRNLHTWNLIYIYAYLYVYNPVYIISIYMMYILNICEYVYSIHVYTWKCCIYAVFAVYIYVYIYIYMYQHRHYLPQVAMFKRKYLFQSIISNYEFNLIT